MQEEFVYLFEAGKELEIDGSVAFRSITFSPFDKFHIAFFQTNDVHAADIRLKAAIKKLNGEILPLPISDGYLEAILYKIRCGAKLKIISDSLSGNQLFLKNLSKIKKRLGRDYKLRIKQSKRLKDLLDKISKFEGTGDTNDLDNICEELYHLGIYID